MASQDATLAMLIERAGLAITAGLLGLPSHVAIAMIVLISMPSLVNALAQALATIVALTTKDQRRAERAITVLNSTRRSSLPSQVETSTEDSPGDSA